MILTLAVFIVLAIFIRTWFGKEDKSFMFILAGLGSLIISLVVSGILFSIQMKSNSVWETRTYPVVKTSSEGDVWRSVSQDSIYESKDSMVYVSLRWDTDEIKRSQTGQSTVELKRVWWPSQEWLCIYTHSIPGDWNNAIRYKTTLYLNEEDYRNLVSYK